MLAIKKSLNFFLIFLLIHVPAAQSQDDTKAFLDAWSLKEVTSIESMLENDSYSFAETKMAYKTFLEQTKESISEFFYLDFTGKQYDSNKTSIDAKKVQSFLQEKLNPLLSNFDEIIQTKDDIRESIHEIRGGHEKGFWDHVWDLFDNDTFDAIITGSALILGGILAFMGMVWIYSSRKKLSNKKNVKALKKQLEDINKDIHEKIQPLDYYNALQSKKTKNNRGENVYNLLKEFYEAYFLGKSSLLRRLNQAESFFKENKFAAKRMPKEVQSITQELESLLNETNFVILWSPHWRHEEMFGMVEKINQDMESIKELIASSKYFFPKNSPAQSFKIELKKDTQVQTKVESCIKLFESYGENTHFYDDEKKNKKARKSCLKIAPTLCQKWGHQIKVTCLKDRLDKRSKSADPTQKICAKKKNKSVTWIEEDIRACQNVNFTAFY